MEVIHQGKARVDCKGNKTDLVLKQGDCLDIIRVQGNPEGKWLGRTQDGSSKFTYLSLIRVIFNFTCLLFLPRHPSTPIWKYRIRLSITVHLILSFFWQLVMWRPLQWKLTSILWRIVNLSRHSNLRYTTTSMWFLMITGTRNVELYIVTPHHLVAQTSCTLVKM